MSFDDQVKAIVPVAVDAPQYLRSIAEATDGFLSSSQESAQQLTAQFATTSEKIATMADVIGDLQSELFTMLEELSTAVERAQQRAQDLLSESQGAVAAAREEMQTTTNAFDEAMKAFEAEREHCDTVRTRIESMYERLSGELSARHQQVESQTEVLAVEIQTFESTADELHAKCQETIQTHSEDLGEKRGDIEEKQDEAKQACETRFSECESEMQNLMDNVVTTGANDLMTRAKETIDTALRQTLDEALAQLEGEVDEIIETITKADEETGGLREELEPLIDELKGLIEPLKNAIQGVMALKESFM